MSARRGTSKGTVPSRGDRFPYVVGLTGNFGVGKSTVAHYFWRKGACVIDSDRLAHEAFRRGSRLRSRIRSLFPELGGTVSRPGVAEIVFKDSRRRRALEALIHPYVFQRIGEEIQCTRKRIAVVEVPLLFESGFDRRCDATIVVKAEPAAVRRRLLGKGFRPAEVRARWRAQGPTAQKIGRADFVIDNSKGKERTRRQVESLWPRLVSKTRKELV